MSITCWREEKRCRCLLTVPAPETCNVADESRSKDNLKSSVLFLPGWLVGTSGCRQRMSLVYISEVSAESGFIPELKLSDLFEAEDLQILIVVATSEVNKSTSLRSKFIAGYLYRIKALIL